MLKRILSIGVISTVCFVGMCDTSEAGRRHRRSRQTPTNDCCMATPEPVCCNTPAVHYSHVNTYHDNCNCQPMMGSIHYGNSHQPAIHYGGSYQPGATMGTAVADPTNVLQGGQVKVDGSVGAGPVAAGNAVNIER